ncbi:aminotransferase class I/II-fold pyridoxal phosphate-dependent enzyme [Mucilaginibacter sp. KACC 22063]|uniref:aminotransferase class I/II-fold pyridoxal phosphate-dependent enzyme n=1 Tax=Mucilaginibacter sp. KACC 22063 TaxID=3025666 RepID=UPI0023671C12|nr:aminotransferase class I/II-fold pyridoxal phosphate-dependent enzyme [Mucilaginibacter sp. KACC 22063]WDF54365.1 aminotransferase class I/II-fold pyridoxal phosphate-dependent enzyme [Mucilaginibacter sp. KACC 22063]
MFKHNINFAKASFKDFEAIPTLDAFERASLFQEFTDYMRANSQMNFRFLTTMKGNGPEMWVTSPFNEEPQKCVSLVSNDYLNFTQHPLVKKATIDAIEKYGTGAGASPLIGGHHEYHEMLQEKIAAFFGRPADSALIFTTGYTANSASLLALLKKEDVAIVDMAVHASVFEGCKDTNVKMFLHNDLSILEKILRESQGKYKTRLVIIDGVYSQDGDLAKMKEILELTRRYAGYLMVDDAHGIGVLGQKGRGVMEIFDVINQVDIISGTLSKAFGHVGGFIVASPEIINFLKFQSRQQVFSSTSTPASAGLLKAIDLIDEEPHWRQQLADNVAYFKKGLTELKLDIGNTESAIIPVKIGDAHKTGDAGRLLLKAGVYANTIVYPGVARKNARIRTSLMATHTREHLDKALNAFEYVNQKLHLSLL